MKRFSEDIQLMTETMSRRPVYDSPVEICVFLQGKGIREGGKWRGNMITWDFFHCFTFLRGF